MREAKYSFWTSEDIIYVVLFLSTSSGKHVSFPLLVHGQGFLRDGIKKFTPSPAKGNHV